MGELGVITKDGICALKLRSFTYNFHRQEGNGSHFFEIVQVMKNLEDLKSGF